MATAEVSNSSSEVFTAALAYSLDELRLTNVSLKEEQRVAIKAVYEGRDTFICLPTFCDRLQAEAGPINPKE